jgi:hypothetical protein
MALSRRARGAAVSRPMMRLSMLGPRYRRECAVSRHEKLIIILLLILNSRLDSVPAELHLVSASENRTPGKFPEDF